PNLRNHVLGRHIITPLDLQRDYNLLGGNIFHVPMTLEYAFDARPAAVSGGYRTPIGGLYLCGAGTHPGGAVTGAPGRNAAQSVLEDRMGGRAAGEQPGRSSSRGLVDQLMESEIGAKLGYGVARHPLLRPLARLLSKNPRR
ncbi:MAG: phytoene desaturase family protein, partial [Dongiales bacterium]